MSNLAQRQAAERAIARAAIKGLLEAGYMLSLNDGEGFPVRRSTNANEIFNAMFSVDEETLIARNVDGDRVGAVFFVYGNDGYDVINDYSMSLDAALAGAKAEADKRERATI